MLARKLEIQISISVSFAVVVFLFVLWFCVWWSVPIVTQAPHLVVLELHNAHLYASFTIFAFRILCNASLQLSAAAAQCAAHYITGSRLTVPGDPTCCGQGGTVTDISKICPRERPICVGFVQGETYGFCRGGLLPTSHSACRPFILLCTTLVSKVPLPPASGMRFL